MKILLTDDERMVRLGLISMLEELYPRQHEFREAKNGREMLEIARDFQPDIAFIDIRMPVLDGLAALEQLRGISPETQCLILTGHSDFEYARTCLRLGAVDYLLKPVGLDILEPVIQKAMENIASTARQANTRFAHQIVHAYNTGRMLGQAATTELAVYPPLRVSMLIVDHPEPETRLRQYHALSDSLRVTLEQRMDATFCYAIFFARDGELCVVTAGHPSSPGDPQSGSHIPGLRALLLAEIADPERCTTCLDRKDVPPQEFFSACSDLSRLAAARMLYGCGRLLAADAAFRERAERLLPLAIELQKLCAAFLSGQEIEYNNVLSRLLTGQAESGVLLLKADPESVRRFFQVTIGCAVDIDDFASFCRSLDRHVQRIYRTKKPQLSEIDWAKTYIQENYMNDIDIKSIAQQMGISPNYLSRIFHERVGSKFIDYLTSVRIASAKRLFSQRHDITVKETAGLVGYISVRHFTKTFSRLVGCLPSEYQLRQQQAADGSAEGKSPANR